MSEGVSRTPDMEVRQQIVRMGSAIYERLKEQLEAEAMGKQVPIHVDTGEYAVARTSAEAGRALLAERRPDGRMFVRKVGD